MPEPVRIQSESEIYVDDPWVFVRRGYAIIGLHARTGEVLVRGGRNDPPARERLLADPGIALAMAAIDLRWLPALRAALVRTSDMERRIVGLSPQRLSHTLSRVLRRRVPWGDGLVGTLDGRHGVVLEAVTAGVALLAVGEPLELDLRLHKDWTLLDLLLDLLPQAAADLARRPGLTPELAMRLAERGYEPVGLDPDRELPGDADGMARLVAELYVDPAFRRFAERYMRGPSFNWRQRRRGLVAVVHGRLIGVASGAGALGYAPKFGTLAWFTDPTHVLDSYEETGRRGPDVRYGDPSTLDRQARAEVMAILRPVVGDPRARRLARTVRGLAPADHPAGSCTDVVAGLLAGGRDPSLRDWRPRHQGEDVALWTDGRRLALVDARTSAGAVIDGDRLRTCTAAGPFRPDRHWWERVLAAVWPALVASPPPPALGRLIDALGEPWRTLATARDWIPTLTGHAAPLSDGRVVFLATDGRWAIVDPHAARIDGDPSAVPFHTDDPRLSAAVEVVHRATDDTDQVGMVLPPEPLA